MMQLLPNECHGFGLRPALDAARAASRVLLQWVRDTYDLDSTALDRSRGMTPAAFREIREERRFLGYDVSDAPALLLLTIQAYLDLITFDHSDTIAPSALMRHRSGENALSGLALPDLSRSMHYGSC